jgi:Xaa-Pro aminopeptidase
MKDGNAFMARGSKRHRLIKIEWPALGVAACPPSSSLSEFEARIAALRAHMEERKLTHAIVYADREHFANLAYLTGFDPRFEEALLIVGTKANPLILVGNECEAYLGISPLHASGQMRQERFQSFSLLDQPRERSRSLREIFAEEGVSKDSRVGAVGYKYFSQTEHTNPSHSLDIPSYIADTLRGLAGQVNVTNVTEIFMHPAYGLRARCTAGEIAYFEYSNGQAAEAAKRMIFALHEGITDHSVVESGHLNGNPLSCHVTFGTGRHAKYGLCSPSGEIIRRGQPLAFNVAYWGSNICRAGWIAQSHADLPESASDYVASFAGPYFEAMGDWFGLMRPGTPGGQVFDLIQRRLPFEKFGIYLNPGHLIHLDEWMSSPFYAGSEIPISSGMAIQVDVIPQSTQYFSTRMEDGIVIADAELRTQLKEFAPDCFERCQKRRAFMGDVLGIEVPEEVLPLSNTCAIVPPFFLEPNTVLALES